jgi:hypothetical protein
MEMKQETQMTYFTFRYQGVNYNFSSSERRLAMVEANKYFHPHSGAWFERGENQYEWVSGNFFD